MEISSRVSICATGGNYCGSAAACRRLPAQCRAAGTRCPVRSSAGTGVIPAALGISSVYCDTCHSDV